MRKKPHLFFRKENMGNRALIQFDGQDAGVYLHWNGGRDSVEAFLEYCKLRDFRCDDYGIARLCQVVGNFFGGSLSVGIATNIKPEDAEWMDNGIYIVNDWEIVGRIPKNITEQNDYDRVEMLVDIDGCQPEKDRLGEAFIRAPWVETKDLKRGDMIYWKSMEYMRPEIVKVEGIGTAYKFDKQRPYIGYYGDKPWENPNNYLKEEKYKLYQ